VAAEFLGCSVFHVLGSTDPTPWTNGLVLACMVMLTAKTSGGILNPALTLTFCILGHATPLELVTLCAAQVAGCIVGALWLLVLIPTAALRSGNGPGCFHPRLGIDAGTVVAWEATGSFAFFLAVMTVVYYTTHKKGYGSVGPIMVGFALTASALAVRAYTGGALNPARVIASQAIYGCVGSMWGAYVGGQFAAAVLAALVMIPWYGVAEDAWFLTRLPPLLHSRAKVYKSTSGINSVMIVPRETLQTMQTMTSQAMQAAQTMTSQAMQAAQASQPVPSPHPTTVDDATR
jgi:glycerol uptake facilitator-like aquaporin